MNRMDIAIFIVANLVNLLMIGIFLARARGLEKAGALLGIAVVALGVVLIVPIVLNLLSKREWWTIILPLPMILFCALTLILDYVLESGFRRTVLVWPYLVVYYVSLMGMIGYCFLMGRAYGIMTLAVYFLNLLATWYCFSKVGHG